LSIEATVWALKYAPPMPPQLLGTLFGLADHADKRGRAAYPSVRTLAAYACKAERSVQRDLKELPSSASSATATNPPPPTSPPNAGPTSTTWPWRSPFPAAAQATTR
jgi:hypothetical protein